MSIKYKHIFFDLDRTLWDFETSALQAFNIIHEKYNLADLGVESGSAFHDKYTVHNDYLWDLYRKGQISKTLLKGKRFYLSLLDFGIDDKKLAEQIGEDYTIISPKLVNLFPNAIEILEYLFPKYNLHIITNGFKEVQAVKLKSSGMDKYFDKIITSEEAGVKKPDIKIFKYALEKASALSGESLMIGDDYETDIIGAQNTGMNQVYFNPEKKSFEYGCTHEIVDLKELSNFL